MSGTQSSVNRVDFDELVDRRSGCIGRPTQRRLVFGMVLAIH